MLLEPAAAARAAERTLPSEREAFVAQADDLAELDTAATPSPALIRADLDIHRAVYDATHNPHLRDP